MEASQILGAAGHVAPERAAPGGRCRRNSIQREAEKRTWEIFRKSLGAGRPLRADEPVKKGWGNEKGKNGIKIFTRCFRPRTITPGPLSSSVSGRKDREKKAGGGRPMGDVHYNFWTRAVPALGKARN